MELVFVHLQLSHLLPLPPGSASILLGTADYACEPHTQKNIPALMKFTFQMAERRNSKLYAYKLPQAHQHSNIFS